ncbi:venom serine carboxypeptidase-like [Anthonomus grandis grandis]|uniref:venom serine carboxypeptidase-like n=1 Tax=Anthonomus grandis grandis TaxID=2921223 RepID=UPI002165409F|nr:venom serine carboxypeptidase-like [Anthonomus grandis grandis]
MKLVFTLLIVALVHISSSKAEDVGEPLILTPYIENNQIAEGVAAAKVTVEQFASIPSYSGFFTVDKRYDSNLFFWFIPSQNNYEEDPVLLWLQGGPGASSLFGLFVENGPYVVTNGENVSFREHSWTKNHSVLYIDSPAGTGFSFTNGGYAQNQTKVGEDLYEALLQFFQLFPELQKNEFFVTGESYGGKYVPAIGYTIMKKNPLADLKINLKGLLIGNGLVDPEHQIAEYGDYLYNLGFIDEGAKEEFIELQNKGATYMKEGDFENAFQAFDEIINGDYNSETLFKKYTGFSTYFNYLFNSESDESYATFLETPAVRKGIHVGNLTQDSDQVKDNLRLDVVKSIAPWVVELLNQYRVLFYNGQLDIIVAYPTTVNFIKNLNFSAAEEYKTAPRIKWRIDGNIIAGYSKTAGNLTEVLVRNAGHMVPTDQPEWAYDLVYKFVRNIALS